MIGRILSHGLVLAAGVLVVVACGSDAGDDGSSSGSSGASGSSSGTFGGSSGSSGTTTDDLAGCANQTVKGEALPLDIYIMLDVSFSMTEPTSGGATKLAAVKDALKGFINDPSSAGVGVGLGIFPIQHAGTPDTCTANNDCSAAGGRCFVKACHPPTATSPIQSCDSSADCPGGAACEFLGDCPTNPPSICLVGDPNYGCKQGNKSYCSQWQNSFCELGECVAGDYSSPRVAIAGLPGNASALVSSIDGIPTPPQSNATPTSSAISGGLAVAKPYATANAGHAVVVVLATDGLPTRCSPTDIPGIAALAKGGVDGTPSIKTFVLGIFTDQEKPTAQPNLDTIAGAGGTNKALIVSTSSNVAADFKAALDQIRGAALPCDYKVPQPTSGTPDYDKVNVAFTPMSGAKELVIPKTSGSGACDANGGWYYDVDPAAGEPTKIILCPASCTAVKSASGTGSKVDVLLGCKTIVK